ncbi:amino acid permease-domain-containing protein [Cladochytrium replicatum]|nr:amino acid permease-domain-containing protein [Cladochytrium replicatum]
MLDPHDDSDQLLLLASAGIANADDKLNSTALEKAPSSAPAAISPTRVSTSERKVEDDDENDGGISLDFERIYSIPLSLSRRDGELKRSVSLFSGLSLIVGMCIGSGIFASPGPIFGYTGSVGMSLIVWIGAGLLAMTGSLCYAELGTMIPASGGEHPYLMKAYGSFPAFLFSWTGVTVTRPGSVAIITTIFAEYFVKMFYLNHPPSSAPSWLVKIVALTCVALLTWLNCISTKLGTVILDIFTVLKTIALIFIGIIGVALLAEGASRSHNYDNLFQNSSTNPGDYALALYSALWAYDGWNSLNLVAGELVDPEKNVPRAVLIGPFIVIVCYVMANVAYYAVLPAEIVKSTNTIASDFGKQLFGSIGGIIFPIVVIGSTFGAANASVFTGARVIYVSAKHGHAPKFLGNVHPERNTPIAALLLQGGITGILICFGSFTSLVNFYSMIAWTFYFLAVLALLVLRWQFPLLARPFRVWLIVPLIFCAVTIFLISFSVFEAPGAAVGAFLFLASGIPIYVLGCQGYTWESFAGGFWRIFGGPIMYVREVVLDWWDKARGAASSTDLRSSLSRVWDRAKGGYSRQATTELAFDDDISQECHGVSVKTMTAFWESKDSRPLKSSLSNTTLTAHEEHYPTRQRERSCSVSHTPTDMSDMIVCSMKSYTVNLHKIHEIVLRCLHCDSEFQFRATHDCEEEFCSPGRSRNRTPPPLNRAAVSSFPAMHDAIEVGRREEESRDSGSDGKIGWFKGGQDGQVQTVHLVL